MSPKAKKAAPKAKVAEKSAQPAKTASKKSMKAALEEETPALAMSGEKSEDEADEEEEAAAVSAGSSNSGGNAAALAAASGTTEMSASFKNFRHHPDMENFYRFIFENDLRLEALAIINDMMVERANRKAVRSAKANAH